MYYTVDRYVERDGRESVAPSHIICADKEEVARVIKRLVDVDIHHANMMHGEHVNCRLENEGDGNCTWQKLSVVNPYTAEKLYTIKYFTFTLWPLALGEE